MKIIKINQEVRIPKTDIILEKGDKIAIQERTYGMMVFEYEGKYNTYTIYVDTSEGTVIVEYIGADEPILTPKEAKSLGEIGLARVLESLANLASMMSVRKLKFVN